MDKDAAWIGKCIEGWYRDIIRNTRNGQIAWRKGKAVHKKYKLNGTRNGLINRDRNVIRNGMAKVLNILFLKPHGSKYNEKRYENNGYVKQKHPGKHAEEYWTLQHWPDAEQKSLNPFQFWNIASSPPTFVSVCNCFRFLLYQDGQGGIDWSIGYLARLVANILFN